MKKLRLNTRVLVYHENKLLLVRNKNAHFWYPPGGGWEYEHETIQECAVREVYEETGYQINLRQMLWAQELRDHNQIYFETFWLADLAKQNAQTTRGLASHIDHDPAGMVAAAKWFTEAELQSLKIFPEQAKRFANFTAAPSSVFLGIFP